MPEAWIIDACRSPRGKGKETGGLHGIHPQELLAQVLNALAARTGIPLGDVDDVVVGNNENVGDHGSCIGRMAVLAAGWPTTVPGVTLNRFCGSGQQAVNFAAHGVLSGQQQLVVAAGVESMSRITQRQPLELAAGNAELLSKYPLVPQGVSADLIATLEGFSRAELDGLAVESQRRAAVAISEGRFWRSLVPIRYPDGGLALDHDEHPRAGTTLETLSALPPSFERQGTRPREGGPSFDERCKAVYPQIDGVRHVHHAGNSSGIVDGAGAVLVASDDYARANGLTPRARIISTAVLGDEPVVMLTAPGPASRRALDRAGLSVSDINIWEINEAFAAVSMKVIRDLKLDAKRVNVNGGAIALGHPIGASGAMLVGTAVDELERQDETLALVTMCTGGGMATATVIERL